MTAEKLQQVSAGPIYSDPALASIPLEALQLNLLLENTQLQLALRHNQEFVHLAVYHFPENQAVAALRFLLSQEEWLRKNYSRVHIGLSVPELTLVPGEFLDGAQADTLFDFNFSHPSSGRLYTDTLPDLAANLLYRLPDAVDQLLRLHFPQATLQHGTTALLKALPAENNEEALYVYVQPGQLQFLYLQGHKLKYFNLFRYVTGEDYCYHLMNVCNQLHLDREKIKVMLLGEVVRQSDVFQYAYKYIRQIGFGRRYTGATYSPSLQMPENFYYQLFAL